MGLKQVWPLLLRFPAELGGIRGALAPSASGASPWTEGILGEGQVEPTGALRGDCRERE